MQFTKPMIDLVYAIRRASPSDLKPSIKLTNPDLFDELKVLYYNAASTVTKALIKELFHLAGPNWESLLRAQESDLPPQNVKVYRGLTMFEDRPENSEKKSANLKKRVYRGQVVHA